MRNLRHQQRGWIQKFTTAWRGLFVGTRGQSSFRAHAVFASAVMVAAVAFNVSRIEWCLLILCTTVVLAAEMFNTALETLAQAVDENPNPMVGDSLDIASAAVLIAALGAACVGLIVFMRPLIQWIGCL